MIVNIRFEVVANAVEQIVIDKMANQTLASGAHLAGNLESCILLLLGAGEFFLGDVVRDRFNHFMGFNG